MQFRQGDIFIESIKSIPKTAKAFNRDVGVIVLARGASTGHVHGILTKGVIAKKIGDVIYLSSTKSFEVTHDEHDTIKIKSGKYIVGYQREYTPEEIRRVVD